MTTSKALRLPLVAFLLLVPASGRAGPVPPVNDERDLAEQDRNSSVVIYNRSTTAPCFADYVPDVEEVLAPFVLRMARNEYEPMQLALYVPGGANPLQDVRVEVHADIPSKIGHLYYQPRETLEWVSDLDTDRGKPWEGKRNVLPHVVIPRNQIDTIEPARNGVFWITFKTDETIAPGVHRGKNEVYAADKLLRSVPFLIKVHAFSLPRSAITYGLYFLPYRLDPRFQGRAFQKLYLEDLVAYGMNTMFTTVDYEVLSEAGYDETSTTPHQEVWYSTSSRLYCDNYMEPGDYETEGEYNAIKFIDAQLAMGRQAGLIQRDQWLITQPSGYIAENKANVASAIKRLSAEKGWPDMVLYMRDEPGPTVFARVIDHVSQWKREGIKTTCAMSILTAFAVGHVHDLWIVHAGYVTPELQREAAQLGARLSTYNFSLRTTNAETGRYYSGLYTWSLGLAANTSYNYVWLPSKGPVPGVGFEGRREGVDDYRTLQLLEGRGAGRSRGQGRATLARSPAQGKFPARISPGLFIHRRLGGSPPRSDPGRLRCDPCEGRCVHRAAAPGRRREKQRAHGGSADRVIPPGIGPENRHDQTEAPGRCRPGPARCCPGPVGVSAADRADRCPGGAHCRLSGPGQSGPGGSAGDAQAARTARRR